MDYYKATEDALQGDAFAVYEILAKESGLHGQEEVLRVIQKISREKSGVNSLSLGITLNGSCSRDTTLFLSDGTRKSLIPLVTIESIPSDCK